MTTTAARQAGYSVNIASGEALDVREFAVRERMSSLFSVVITAVSESADLDFEGIIGQPARFEMHAGLAGSVRTRAWTGVCKEIEEIAVEETGLSTYSIEIVPTLWLADQRRNHRMFQLMSDVDIALQLLSEWGIEPQRKLTGTYKKRKYRVQYGESDFAFVCRLLEDAGVSFYFTSDEAGSRLVLADAPHADGPREARIAFRDRPGDADLEHVTSVRVARRVRQGRVTLRDHDYRRPPAYKLVATAAGASSVEERLEHFEYAPGAFLFESDKGDATPHADDKGRYRADEAEAAAMAKRRLDAERTEALRCLFSTNAIDVAPGVVFGMRDHPRRELGDDRHLLVVEATMRGKVGEHLKIDAEARSTDLAYRPQLVTPKPKVNGVESATVVGPAGQEIHTDEFGRVRVHFHWDRESQMNENSSCWIHVSQSWGGAGYGGVNLPRVGQEVLVDFLGGDPDRPVVVGRVYTNLQRVPYTLPDNKTQSGWRSNSTEKTGGYNEIMFEDAAGKELLRMQAEKDLHKLVKNDEEATIGRDRAHTVQRNERLTVGKNRTKQVAENEQEMIGQNHRVVVGVNRATQVGSVDSTIVGETHVVMVSPPGESFKDRATSTVIKNNKITFNTGGGATATMEGDAHSFDSKEMWIKASSVMQVLTSNFHVFADSSVVLQVGGSSIKIGTSSIDIVSGGTITIDGAVVDVKGKPIKLNS